MLAGITATRRLRIPRNLGLFPQSASHSKKRLKPQILIFPTLFYPATSPNLHAHLLLQLQHRQVTTVWEKQIHNYVYSYIKYMCVPHTFLYGLQRALAKWCPSWNGEEVEEVFSLLKWYEYILTVKICNKSEVFKVNCPNRSPNPTPNLSPLLSYSLSVNMHLLWFLCLFSHAQNWGLGIFISGFRLYNWYVTWLFNQQYASEVCVRTYKSIPFFSYHCTISNSNGGNQSSHSWRDMKCHCCLCLWARCS